MIKNKFLSSIISASFSILPIILIIMLLSIIPSPKGTVNLVELVAWDYFALGIGGIILILGSALFSIGADNGLTKVGEYMGSSLSKQSKIAVVVIFAFLLGALITCAEPSILIISSQVNIPTGVLIAAIALGVGIFTAVGILRIIFHGNLKLWYIVFYFIVFMLVILIMLDEESRKFLPFIFDAGGITTGSATVPFILALGAGVAMVRGGKKSSEDSFGLVGIASIGPILTMIILILVNRSGFAAYNVPLTSHFDNARSLFKNLTIQLFPHDNSLGQLIEVAMALLPIIIIFFIYDRIYIKLPKEQISKVIVGFIYSYIGLVIFLIAINGVMTPFGYLVGEGLGNITKGSIAGYDWMVIGIAFLIGLVSILCEPAVHVLTAQINTISGGTIKKRTVLIAMCLGVGLAIGLATLRSIFNFSIMYYIVPGYLLVILLMFICPNIYSAAAFDSGGTASGPMSVSFILPMVIGITKAKFDYPQSSVIYYEQSFGVVALIALIPILTIELLGVGINIKNVKALKAMRGRFDDPRDAQIIHF